jgi:hypothetical protein
MATTQAISDYLNSLAEKDRLSTTDKITVVDIDGGNSLKSVSIANISGSLVITGSVTATIFEGTIDASYIDFSNVPISASELSVGSLYKEDGFLKIVE